MKILVTGGAGFQGSNLAEKWASAGHEVTILNTYSELAKENIGSFPAGVSVVWGSVTDKEIVEKTVRGHDVVVHMAAHINVDESVISPRDFLDVNIGGTMNVLEAVRATECRMIFASSCEVYGYTHGSPATEDAPLSPHSPYAASKSAADRMCFAYHESYGLDITILRPCNIYGPRQRSGRGGAVIPIFMRQALASEPLRVFGDGSQRREYMHVKDLVSAYDLVLQRDDLSRSLLNVGTGETPSIIEIARFICDRTGASMIHEPARPGEVRRFALDSSRMRSLGFSPEIKFWDGISSYVGESQRVGSVSS